MPLRSDVEEKGYLIPKASGWRRGFVRTGYTVEDYVDLEDVIDD